MWYQEKSHRLYPCQVMQRTLGVLWGRAASVWRKFCLWPLMWLHQWEKALCLFCVFLTRPGSLDLSRFNSTLDLASYRVTQLEPFLTKKRNNFQEPESSMFLHVLKTTKQLFSQSNRKLYIKKKKTFWGASNEPHIHSKLSAIIWNKVVDKISLTPSSSENLWFLELLMNWGEMKEKCSCTSLRMYLWLYSGDLFS